MAKVPSKKAKVESPVEITDEEIDAIMDDEIRASIERVIGQELARFDQATIADVKMVTTTGAWRLVFEVPPAERDQIPILSAEHQRGFVLIVARKKRRKLRDAIDAA